VWQAEEVFVDGKWRRYYGFVGKGAPARVPAEEIEFPATGQKYWYQLSGGLDCLAEPAAKRVEVGKPATVRLLLRNRLGIDQEVPALWSRKGAGGAAELREGLDVEVSYLPPEDGPVQEQFWGDEPAKPWRPQKPRAVGRFRDAAVQTLRCAGELAAVEVDLRDWFDLSRPGYYRVEFVFRGRAEERSREVVICVGVD
jgi:hypothetical protein